MFCAGLVLLVLRVRMTCSAPRTVVAVKSILKDKDVSKTALVHLWQPSTLLFQRLFYRRLRFGPHDLFKFEQ